MILMSDDVWGAPFQEPAGNFSILRRDDLWSNPEKLKKAVSNATVLVVRNRTQVTVEIITVAPQLKDIARAGVGLDL